MFRFEPMRYNLEKAYNEFGKIAELEFRIVGRYEKLNVSSNVQMI